MGKKLKESVWVKLRDTIASTSPSAAEKEEALTLRNDCACSAAVSSDVSSSYHPFAAIDVLAHQRSGVGAARLRVSCVYKSDPQCSKDRHPLRWHAHVCETRTCTGAALCFARAAHEFLTCLQFEPARVAMSVVLLRVFRVGDCVRSPRAAFSAGRPQPHGESDQTSARRNVLCASWLWVPGPRPHHVAWGPHTPHCGKTLLRVS